MKNLLLCLCLAVPALLGGCSLFSSRPSLQETQDALRLLREQVKPDHNVVVTLVGGTRLNPGAKGTPRPVRVCVYLTSMSDWAPPPGDTENGCVTLERETSLLASQRRILAPEQLLQLSLVAPGGRDSWIVVDADFGERAPGYKPLRLPVDNQERVQVNAWLDGNRVSNALEHRKFEEKP